MNISPRQNLSVTCDAIVTNAPAWSVSYSIEKAYSAKGELEEGSTVIIRTERTTNARVISDFEIFNADSVSHEITILQDSVILMRVVLSPEDHLVYNIGSKWQVLDGAGNHKVTSTTSSPAIIQVDGVVVSTGVPTIDLDGNDFIVTESPVDDFDVAFDYSTTIGLILALG